MAATVFTMNGWPTQPWAAAWKSSQDWASHANASRPQNDLRSGCRPSAVSAPLSVDTSKLSDDGTLIRSDRLARLEAVLMISRSAVSAKKLAQQAGLIDAAETRQLVELLNSSYDKTRSAFRIEKTATGYLLMTRAVLVTWLDRIHERQAQMKLSAPAMETLTIIAYQQPITRVGVEAIRGAQCTEMIRQLIDRGLVKVGGEEDSLGRPFLYITTREFLDMFGLDRIRDLPDYDSIGRQTDDQPEVVDSVTETNETDQAA